MAPHNRRLDYTRSASRVQGGGCHEQHYVQTTQRNDAIIGLGEKYCCVYSYICNEQQHRHCWDILLVLHVLLLLLLRLVHVLLLHDSLEP